MEPKNVCRDNGLNADKRRLRTYLATINCSGLSVGHVAPSAAMPARSRRVVEERVRFGAVPTLEEHRLNGTTMPRLITPEMQV
jgi:hypothetical protein